MHSFSFLLLSVLYLVCALGALFIFSDLKGGGGMPGTRMDFSRHGFFFVPAADRFVAIDNNEW